MKAAYTIENLSCRLGRVDSGESFLALNNINLTVPKGSILGIVGSSGAGKTTLLRILAGLTLPTSGRCLKSDPDAARVGMVFQGEALYPWLNVTENVIFPARHGRPRSSLSKDELETKAAELLSEVSLPASQFGERFPHELSGGERRRVAIAAALMSSATILLLDEPTTGLDDLNKWRFQELLLRLRSEHGFTCALVTHDLEEAVFVADEVILLQRGSILERISVPFPVHRPHELRYEAEFTEIRRTVSKSLYGEGGRP